MNRDLAIILLSAVLATLNPSLLAAVTVMLLLPNPKRLMLGYLLGAYTTSIAAGLAIVFSLARIKRRHNLKAHRPVRARTSRSPRSRSRSHSCWQPGATRRSERGVSDERQAKASDRQTKQPWQQRMLGRGTVGVTFVVGAVVSFPGVSYLNALDHIVKLNPPTVPILLLVLYFCLMQQILLELPLLASLFAAEWTQGIVVRFKAWLARHGRRIAVIALSAIGILLATRGLLTIH